MVDMRRYRSLSGRIKYIKKCSYCGKTFETTFKNKNLCCFNCKQQHQKDRAVMLKNNKKNHIKHPCIICGFNEVVDIHTERGNIYYICPNHHAIITRNGKTINDLLSLSEYHI